MATSKLHQQFSALDNEVFSAFCESFDNVNWTVNFTDSSDKYCGIDVQLTGETRLHRETYDVEIKSVHLSTELDYCFFEADKWYSLIAFDNEVKLYVVIYPNLNKIAAWRVNNKLLSNSEIAMLKLKNNTCNGGNAREKKVYKLKLSDAAVYDFDLKKYKERFNGLHQQTKQK